MGTQDVYGLVGQVLDGHTGAPKLESITKSVTFPAAPGIHFAYKLQTPHGDAPPFNLLVSDLAEQVEGATLDHRTDLYAFGLILDEMLTGELVFKADSALQLMLKRVREHPRSPRAVIADLPEYVERIIMRCLQTNPSARYQSAREILRDLDAQRADSPIEASPHQTWVSGQVGDAVTASPLPAVAKRPSFPVGRNSA